MCKYFTLFKSTLFSITLSITGTPLSIICLNAPPSQKRPSPFWWVSSQQAWAGTAPWVSASAVVCVFAAMVMLGEWLRALTQVWQGHRHCDDLFQRFLFLTMAFKNKMQVSTPLISQNETFFFSFSFLLMVECWGWIQESCRLRRESAV